MIFIVDIGNSNTVIGIYKGEDLIKKWRILTDKTLTADDILAKISALMMFDKVDPKDITQCVISSVVPTWNYAWERFSIEFLKMKPLLLKYDTKCGISWDVLNSSEMGADRIANSAAAAVMFPQGSFIIDSGTAITLDIIDPDKKYVGGSIMPGVKISMEALSMRTAQLPRFDLNKPPHAVGTTTLGQLQGGVFYGFVGMVDRVIEESLKEIDFEPKIIATGGLAEAIASASHYITEFDKDLTLKGLRIIAELNKN